MPTSSYDAVIVGAGPNGLAAAITLARAGRSVLVIEGHAQTGGGTRTAELTLPGFQHDICSAIHPLGLASPFFRELPLAQFGLEWVHPTRPLAHVLDGGRAAALEQSLEATCEGLGGDGPAYRRLMKPLVDRWQDVLQDLLGPLPLPPRHPLVDLQMGLPGLLPASSLARMLFKSEAARAMVAGMAGHAMLPLSTPMTSAVGLMLGLLGHAVGWPMAKGGSQRIAEALTAYLCSLGGEVITGQWVKSLDELPASRAVLLDVTPRQLIAIAGDKLPAGYRRQLERYRYGQGVFKVDWALDGPIPWQAEAARGAATVHVGGTLTEVAASEAAAWRGEHAERPFVLLAQQSLFDPSRAPDGKHTAWAYCHVPRNSTVDRSGAIEAQVERFAPGFRELILARHTHSPAQMEAYNPNYVGGDINSGVQDLFQMFTRPTLNFVNPYATPLKGVYLCSSSTPPGGGVHGMCGYYAAKAVLRRELRDRDGS